MHNGQVTLFEQRSRRSEALSHEGIQREASPTKERMSATSKGKMLLRFEYLPFEASLG